MIADKNSNVIKLIDFGTSNYFIKDFEEDHLSGTVKLFKFLFILFVY